MQHYTHESQIGPKPEEAINGGTPITVMLKDFTTLNTEASRHLREILLTMARNGGGSTSTRWKGNFIVCTWTIHPTNIMNGNNKIRERAHPTKRSGPSAPEIVETQMKIVDMVSHSRRPLSCSIRYSLTGEFPRHKSK